MNDVEKIERWEILVAEFREKYPSINLGRLCPATFHLPNGSQRVCYDCGDGWCAKFAELGLDEGAAPLKKVLRPKCGAKTRSGKPCQAYVVPGKKRCRIHGGLSTGPKTAKGREKIREAQRRRWRQQH